VCVRRVRLPVLRNHGSHACPQKELRSQVEPEKRQVELGGAQEETGGVREEGGAWEETGELGRRWVGPGGGGGR